MFTVKGIKGYLLVYSPFLTEPDHSLTERLGIRSLCRGGGNVFLHVICLKSSEGGHSGEKKPWHSAQTCCISWLELIYIPQPDSHKWTLSSAGCMMDLNDINPSHMLLCLSPSQKVNSSEFSRVFHQYFLGLKTLAYLQKILEESKTKK